jgi:hypothetical protein
MKKLIFLSFCFLLFTCYFTAQAQDWRWGAKGGSSSSSGTGGSDEEADEMAVDKDGNVYILSVTEGPTNLNANGNPLNGYNNEDVMLASFDCNGNHRWSKMFGGNTGDQASGSGRVPCYHW